MNPKRRASQPFSRCLDPRNRGFPWSLISHPPDARFSRGRKGRPGAIVAYLYRELARYGLAYMDSLAGPRARPLAWASREVIPAPACILGTVRPA
jgi:hypothetical protein